MKIGKLMENKVQGVEKANEGDWQLEVFIVENN